MIREKRSLESVRTNQCLGCGEEPQNCDCIKVHNLLPSPNPFFDCIIKPDVVTGLRKRGIILGRFQNPDFTFTSADRQSHPPNSIAFERMDSDDLVYRELIDNKNVIRIVKSHLNPEEDEKVTPGPSYLHYTKLDDLADYFAKHWNAGDRQIDVCFIGSLYQPGTPVHQHRSELISKLNELPPRIKCLTGTNPWKFIRNDYYRLLSNTKVLVSPWGHGYTCYRDWEGPLAGCITIKPSSSVQTIPNMPVMYCEPDWSNLEEVINHALDAFKADALCMAERRAITELLLTKRAAQAISRIVEGIVCGSKPIKI